MALDDLVSPEVGIAVAATAIVASPRARNTARRALVYGLAGLIRLGDAAGAAARGVGQGAQQVAASAADTARNASEQAQSASEPAPVKTPPKRKA